MNVELEETEFYAEDLIALLQAEGLKSAKVYQSGGGTATFEIREEPQDEALLIGPGSYDWRNSAKSVFTTDELSYGADQYDVDGELKDEDPEQFYIHPDAELTEVARLVAAEYRKLNS
jgi:hypothetical protein